MIAELAQLVGWINSDAGHYRHAEQAYLTGTAAADTAGDRVLGGQLLSSLAYQITNIGNREDGLLIAKPPSPVPSTRTRSHGRPRLGRRPLPRLRHLPPDLGCCRRRLRPASSVSFFSREFDLADFNPFD